MRTWIGMALLSGSWLLGLGYFQPVDLAAWFVMLLAAVVLLRHLPIRLPSRRVRIASLLLLLPAVWSLPLPYKAVPALFALSMLLMLLPIPRLWPKRLSRGAAACGAILFAQMLAISTYEILTARMHALPVLLGRACGLLGRLIGLDAAVDGPLIAIRNGSNIVRIGLTWELLFDPASVCFVVGGLVVILLVAAGSLQRFQRWKSIRRGVLGLITAWLVWAFVRMGLLVSLVLHQTLRADAMTYANTGEVLVSNWAQIALLAGLVILTNRLVSWPARTVSAGSTSAPVGFRRQRHDRRLIIGAVLVGLGTAFLAVRYHATPIGQRKSGRITVVERHSTWEPTTRPYSTDLYGEAGSYNYAAAFAYCEQYYDMTRLLEAESFNDEKLAQCDVLMIKTPTARYSKEEIQAVVRFVERGGSLLLIGDHTNVFNMNTYLNDISRHFGFTFRNDLLFRISDPYKQEFAPPWIPHPILQYVPPMHFAVSCSIDPGSSAGQMVVRNTGLWSLPPAYHESNYHPQAEYRPNMEYGSWCQLWATTHGSGRVVAFADSTLFSNFCTFQPGKTELLMGMLEWLNHRSPWDRSFWRRTLTLLLLVSGVFLLTIGVYVTRAQMRAPMRAQTRARARGTRGGWILLLATVCAAWTATSSGVRAVHRHSMPWPPRIESMPHVVVDRTVSTVPLFTGAFADDESGRGYGMLEQWIPRVGNFISRASGSAAFQGDGLVVICPTEVPSREYRQELVEYVTGGGHLLIIDTPDVEDSTANSLLMLFDMASDHSLQSQSEEPLQLLTDQIDVPIQASAEILGGEPIARWGETPVAARKSVGQGSVTAIGFGSLFNDASMGFHWLPEPEPDVLDRYELLYALLREAMR